MKRLFLPPRRILVRCDGNDVSGLGHLARCVNIARRMELRAPGTTAIFWGDYDEFSKKYLSRYGMGTLSASVPSLSDYGIELTRKLAKEFDLLLLDSYDIDQEYISGIRDSSYRLAVIDDAQRYDLSCADLVICFLAGAEEKCYGSAHQLLGPEYFPVKPELQSIRQRNLQKNRVDPIENVLVFLSGSDSSAEYLTFMLEVLNKTNLLVRYLAKSECRDSVASRAQFTPLTSEMEKLYENADLVICGGGLTKYECAYSCIPNACLSLTPLQHDDTKRMAARGLTLDLGYAKYFDRDRVLGQLTKFTETPREVAKQRENFSSWLYDSGPDKTAELLLSL